MRVGIILATYNGEKYIREQLDSLLAQTWQDFVCYIHDDGSKDATVRICREYAERFPGKFEILDYPPTGGAKQNFFSMMRRVDTDYLFFCDQDDVWLPKKLETMLALVDFQPVGDHGVLTFCDLKVVDAALNEIHPSFFGLNHTALEKINYKWAVGRGNVPGCVMMVNKMLYQSVLCYKNVDNIVMNDWWLFAAAFLTGAEIKWSAEALMLYRQHGNNVIGAEAQTIPQRIMKNVRLFLSGEILRAKREKFICPPRRQAGELLASGLPGIPEEQREFLRAYSEIGSKSKLARVLFYKKHFAGMPMLWWSFLWA